MTATRIMKMHTRVFHSTDGEKAYKLILEDEFGNRIALPCRDRQAVYSLGALIAGAVEVHTKIDVEYL